MTGILKETPKMSHPSLSMALGLQQQMIATPSISTLLHMTQFFPISWRKHILTVCRVQGTHLATSCLQQAQVNLQPHTVPIPGSSSEITKDDLAEMLDLLYPSQLLYSVLSFWTRGESMDYFEAQNALDSAINKELSASQQGNRSQVLFYDILFLSNCISTHLYKERSFLV